MPTVRKPANNKFVRRHWALLVVLALYLALGLAYGETTPMFEGTDEQAHFTFVHYLSQKHELPLLAKNRPHAEARHPPLYYVMGTVLTYGIDVKDFSHLDDNRNPYWGTNIGVIGNDNKNQFLHKTWDAPPYNRTTLALYLLRKYNLLWGALAVAATYFLARRLFPRQPAIAAGALAFVAFNPQYLFVSGAMNNDTIVAALVAWGAVLTLKGLESPLSTGNSLALGVLMGAAALSKQSGLVLLPLFAAVVAWQLYRRADPREALLRAGLTLALTALIAGWWYLRNQLLYGSPTGLGYMRDLIGAPGTLSWNLPELVMVEQSFWAYFGWNNIPMSPWIYWLMRAVVFLALLGLALFCLRRLARRGDAPAEPSWPGLLLLPAWVLVVVVAAANYILFAPNAFCGRHLFTALPPIAILLFLGLAQLAPRRLHTGLALCANLLMLALSIVCLAFFLAPAYAEPPRLDREEAAAIPYKMERQYIQEIALLGYRLDKEQVRPGDTLQVTLYWQVLAPVERNYSTFIQLFGRDGAGIGQKDSYPGLGNYPTTRWQPGEIIADTYPVPVDYEAEAPGVVKISAGLYDLKTMFRLPATDSAGQRLDDTIGLLKLAPTVPFSYTIGHPLSFTLGDNVALLGYDFQAPGGSLVLYWQASSRPAADYTVFVHLLDEKGAVQSQADGPPLGGNYPTSFWDAGEVIRDERRLEMGPGRVRLEVGMYLLETGQRLPVLDGQRQQVPGDSVLIEVGEER